MNIDKTTYPAKNNNFYKIENIKSQIVIGFSLRSDHNHILRMQNKEYGNSKKWNTYTVSREGIIYEHFDPKKHSDFLGNKSFDIKIISIVIENMGAIYKLNNGLYSNILNELCDEERIGLKKWANCDYWEKFSNEQMIALSELCAYLTDEFNIPNECIEFESFNKSIIKYKGIAFKSNYSETSNDINPFFNIDKFNKLLSNK